MAGTNRRPLPMTMLRSSAIMPVGASVPVRHLRSCCTPRLYDFGRLLSGTDGAQATPIGSVNVAIVYGIGLILAAFVLAIIYTFISRSSGRGT